MRKVSLSMLIGLLIMLLAPSAAGLVVSAEECVIPASGPWPPCATSGGGSPAPAAPVAGTPCPASGAWPPGCIPSGSNPGPAPAPATGGEPCPTSGAWPAGCVPGGAAPAPAPVQAPADGNACPASGAWPPGCIPGGAAAEEPATSSSQETGFTTRIVDGDTAVININGGLYSVRLIGIDAPESGQPCSAESTAYLSSLLLNRSVQLEKDVSETDRFDRLLRYLYVDGNFINGEMVSAGLALAKDFPPDSKHAAQLQAFQDDAQKNKRGCLWQTAAAPEPAKPEASGGALEITFIFYDGEEYRAEGDEYVEITNTGGSAINLQGWMINAGDDGQDFRFPSYVMEAGEKCRVYTDEIHNEHCGFSYGSGRAIWNNSGDCGRLYDASNTLVSEKCYGNHR